MTWLEREIPVLLLRVTLVFALIAAAPAAELTLPGKSFERSGTVVAAYKTNSLASGKGELRVRWTDSRGRVIEDKTIAVVLTDEDEISFPLDMSRAAAMQNTVRVQFTFEGKNRKGAVDTRKESAEIDFIARPPERDWNDYHIVMWQQRTPEQIAASALGKSAPLLLC
jgi:hypothetical protein